MFSSTTVAALANTASVAALSPASQCQIWLVFLGLSSRTMTLSVIASCGSTTASIGS